MNSHDSGFFSGAELGMLLENARQIKGWTTADAALRIGVGENHIIAMESGDYGEFGRELEMLAIKLNIYARKLDMRSEKIQALIKSALYGQVKK